MRFLTHGGADAIFGACPVLRVVGAGVPHHVTQRGNGRERRFFGDEDYSFYKELLRAHCRAAGVEIWAFVLTLFPDDPGA